MQTAKQHNWPHLVLAVLLVQAAYWLLVAPLITGAPPEIDPVRPSSFAVAQLDSPDWEAAQAAEYTPAETPWSSCCEGGYYAARFTFDLDTVPEGGLGEAANVTATNYYAYLNGSLYFGSGEMRLPDTSFHGRVFRGLHRLPSGLLREGSNELVYIMASAPGTEGFRVDAPTMGLYETTAAGTRFRLFLLNDYVYASVAIGFAIGLIALMAWARSRQGSYLFWLGMLASSWAGALLMMIIPDPPVTGALWLFLGVPISLMIPVAGVNLANSWGPRRLPHVTIVTLAAWALGLAFHAYAVFLDPGNGRQLWMLYSLVVILSSAFAAIILWNIPVIGRERHWEAAVFLLLFAIAVRTGISIVFDLGWGQQTNYAIPILLVALVAAFVARNIRLFSSAEDFNKELQGQLDERTAELATAHQREKALLREQAHQDERRRIMADMHDGLGSQLMSLLLLARRGKADPERVTRGLQGALDEMRLMIDSMDSVGESLGSALALFRERANERVSDAGLAFEWNDSADGNLPALPPRAVLQVFRVLQEALTNALKHSNGNTVTVNVASHAISVCDNGTLLGDERPGGRGLDNMAARASAIGGNFSLQREGEQTVARIELPEQQGGPHGRNRATSDG